MPVPSTVAQAFEAHRDSAAVGPRYVVVISEPDPVAPRVAREWGTPPATGTHVEGAPLRDLGEGRLVLRRAGWHIHDEGLDRHLPATLREARPTLIFPSIHRSEQNVACLTTHPLGNLGPTADFGGRPRTVVPTDSRAMASVLRRLSELGAVEGLGATFESTHHGPELGVPAFFVEIGYGTAPEAPTSAVRILSRAIREFEPDPGDKVAMGVGGGHYAPHFTELTLRRRWAFGHILSRHSLDAVDAPTAREAYRATLPAEGILYARAADAEHAALQGLAPRLRDAEAESRPSGSGKGEASGDARSSGT